MGMMQEFREFAVKGNVIDLAVGVIIGGAFGKIVGSLVDDVIFGCVDTVEPAIIPVVLGGGRPFLPAPAVRRKPANRNGTGASPGWFRHGPATAWFFAATFMRV